ncbi:hypothetical protein GALMADRAFT_145189 [Galerina marginata CBS 339.88]|uniref:Rhodopsin domain-containing protein n=1 Tax=Galerina marginata (strain CBS 339.88) TaxID=685588 RepID=A0A067SIE9_GALM3|nr:hypothetical protein GALMADRAFT_145189 [Galerina marginata CBS 339.88]
MAVVTLPLQSYLGWKVSLSILQVVAISSAVYRLVHRFRIRKTWWDDYTVLVALALDIVYWPLFFLRFPDRIHSKILTGDRRILNSYWLALLPYSIIVWTTRVSLSLSLARIFPWKHPARLWSFILAGIMVLSCIACVLISTVSCKQPSRLIVLGEPRKCILGIGGFPVQNIFVFANDLISDLLLIVSPLILFWRLKLPRQERRLILVVFCGSILTLLFVITFAVIALNKKISLGPDFSILMAGLFHIEVAISLFVCNLTVVSTSSYRALSRRRNQDRPVTECTCTTTEAASESQERSQQPTCPTGQAPTPLTLTEISSAGSFPPENTSDRSDSPHEITSQSLTSEPRVVP